MKKILFPIVFVCLSMLVFGQENKTELTAEEKDELRKKHNSSLQFTTKKPSSTNKSLETTNDEEESDEKIIKVKYYHGTQDSTYKQFNYIKPE